MGWVSWILQVVYCHHKVKGRGVRVREERLKPEEVVRVTQGEARKELRMQVPPETESQEPDLPWSLRRKSELTAP